MKIQFVDDTCGSSGEKKTRKKPELMVKRNLMLILCRKKIQVCLEAMHEKNK